MTSDGSSHSAKSNLQERSPPLLVVGNWRLTRASTGGWRIRHDREPKGETLPGERACQDFLDLRAAVAALVVCQQAASPARQPQPPESGRK